MPRSRIFLMSAVTTSMLWLGSVPEGRVAKNSAQEEIQVHVVDHPRPVSEAVRQIESHFGYVVTYEDTRYVHPDDIVDITKQISRDPTRTTGILGRRNGGLDLTYTPQPGPVETQVGEALEALMTRANAVGTFGAFRVEHDAGGYHVVPIAIKGKTGVMEPFASPLETRITLPQREESGAELMYRLTRAVTARSDVTVQLGTLPLNLMAQARVTVDAQNDRARDVLWRALHSIRPDLSWQLLCDVGERGVYALNVHAVRRQ